MVFTKRGRTLLMVVPLMTVILLSSAASVGRAAAHASGQTLNIAMVSDVNFLDPNLAGSYYDRQILNNVTDKLFDLDAKGRIVPMLATHYTVSKDRMTYTLTLREGVKFQDGTPFNAAAVKFNLDRYRQPTSARYPEVKDITSVTAVGAYTVKIKLDAPFSPLLSIFTDRSGMMMSPKAVQSEGLNFTLHPVGTGPSSSRSASRATTLHWYAIHTIGGRDIPRRAKSSSRSSPIPMSRWSTCSRGRWT
jgi:peptide/nickel transport system substrate-binding protein